jgi:hypothetical protein
LGILLSIKFDKKFINRLIELIQEEVFTRILGKVENFHHSVRPQLIVEENALFCQENQFSHAEKDPILRTDNFLNDLQSDVLITFSMIYMLTMMLF